MLFSINPRFPWRGGMNLKMRNRKWLFHVSECTLSSSNLDLPFGLSQSSHIPFYPISRAITNLTHSAVFLLLTSLYLNYFRKVLINYYSYEDSLTQWQICFSKLSGEELSWNSCTFWNGSWMAEEIP